MVATTAHTLGRQRKQCRHIAADAQRSRRDALFFDGDAQVLKPGNP
jgi:hypothetical protein